MLVVYLRAKRGHFVACLACGDKLNKQTINFYFFVVVCRRERLANAPLTPTEKSKKKKEKENINYAEQCLARAVVIPNIRSDPLPSRALP